MQDGQNAGQRISRHFPFFMYLWHAIKPACLDREITSCLPTNKPPARLSGPPIYYSQSAVMSRSKRQHSHGQGYTRRPRTFQRGIGNPGVQTNNKKKNSLKSDGLDSNQRAAQRAGKSDGAVNNPPAETPAHNKKHAQGEKVFQRNIFKG